MAFDAYLKLKGVEGEATQKGFEKQIPLLSFSFGAHNPSSPVGAGAGAGKVQISGFTITKWTDKSSAQLFQTCCSGKHFPEAKVTVLKAGGDKPVEYLSYEFKELFVNDIQWAGATGGDDVPMETVSFSFGQIQVTYTEQKPDGTPGTPQVAGWDLQGGKAIGK
jgi:type VI secretion system secreted protein Hcp